MITKEIEGKLKIEISKDELLLKIQSALEGSVTLQDELAELILAGSFPDYYLLTNFVVLDDKITLDIH